MLVDLTSSCPTFLASLTVNSLSVRTLGDPGPLHGRWTRKSAKNAEKNEVLEPSATKVVGNRVLHETFVPLDSGQQKVCSSCMGRRCLKCDWTGSGTKALLHLPPWATITYHQVGTGHALWRPTLSVVQATPHVYRVTVGDATQGFELAAALFRVDTTTPLVMDKLPLQGVTSKTTDIYTSLLEDD